MSVAAWVVARAGREEQVGVVEAARAPEAAVARAQAKLGQEVAAARARETRAVAVAEAAVAVVKAAEAGVAQEPLGLVAAVGRAQAAPAAVVEAGMAPESASRPERARRTALIQRGEARDSSLGRHTDGSRHNLACYSLYVSGAWRCNSAFVSFFFSRGVACRLRNEKSGQR